VRIPVGSGVCGTAAEQAATLRVANVHDFPSHIACDPASKSELVVPLISGGELFAVLDIDSPDEDRFRAADQRGVESLCAQFVRSLQAETRKLQQFI
jgi:GAF domain-containing protein